MKDAYYFSHDSNARHDPKILEMRADYGAEGYGWYWMIIEILREQEDHKIRIKNNVYGGLAIDLNTDKQSLEKFINDCINVYELLQSDGEFLWNNSLLKRMERREELGKIRAIAGKKGGKKSKRKANAKQMLSKDKAKISEERKGKEIKGNNKENNTKEMKFLIDHFNQRFGKRYQLTSGIRDKIRTRLKSYEYDDLIKAIDIISQIPFYRGKNDRDWVASPKYLFRSDDVVDEILNKEDEIDTRKLIIEEARECFKKSKDCQVKISKDMPEKCKVCYRERVKWKT